MCLSVSFYVSFLLQKGFEMLIESDTFFLMTSYAHDRKFYTHGMTFSRGFRRDGI